MSDVHNSKYCTTYLKKHKRSNKLILFVCFKEDVVLDNLNEVLNIIKYYNNIIKNNDKVSSIIDARGVIRCTKNVAFSTSESLLQYKGLYKSKLDKIAIILEQPLLKLLLDSVTMVHPFVVPSKIVNSNNSAIDFVINKTD